MLASTRTTRAGSRDRTLHGGPSPGWVQAELLGLQAILDSGHLNHLERVLRGPRTAHLLRSGNVEHTRAVEEMH